MQIKSYVNVYKLTSAPVKTGSTAETARDVLIRQCEEVKLAKVNLVQVKLTSQLILIM